MSLSPPIFIAQESRRNRAVVIDEFPNRRIPTQPSIASLKDPLGLRSLELGCGPRVLDVEVQLGSVLTLAPCRSLRIGSMLSLLALVCGVGVDLLGKSMMRFGGRFV